MQHTDGQPESVTADDVLHVVDAAVTTLTPALDRDWHVAAGGLEWTCWETVEHVADDLFTYAIQLGPRRPTPDTHVPVVYAASRPGGPASTIFAEPAAGPAGLLQVLEGCGALLAAMVRVTPPSVRAYHPDGAADPEGFAAMGVVETLVHLHDVATGLGLPWQPDAALCARVLHRLFPAAPADTDPWRTLLSATGRGELPGHPAVTGWRWEPAPMTDQPERP